MMGVAGRYLARAAIGSALLALAVILTLELIFEFIDEADKIGEGSYGLGDVLLYLGASIPEKAYRSLPVTTLIGALMGLGALAARHELVVLRAAGLSPWGIARPVLLAGFVMAVIGFAVGEKIAPESRQWAESMRSEARSERFAGQYGGDMWLRDGEDFVRIGRALARDRLVDVRVYRLDETQRPVSIVQAKEARHEGGAWVLRDVTTTRFDETGVKVSFEARQDWSPRLGPDELEVVVLDPNTLSARALYAYVGYLEDNGLETDQYRLTFWRKLVTPLATVVMIVLAFPLVFGGVRSTSAGKRIFIGVIIGIVFMMADRLLGEAALVYGLPPALSALAPTMLFLLFGVIGMQRIR